MPASAPLSIESRKQFIGSERAPPVGMMRYHHAAQNRGDHHFVSLSFLGGLL